MYRLALSFAGGFVLAAVLFGASSLFAQSAPADYLKKAETHILEMAYDGDTATDDTPEKRLADYKAAQKFFGDTKPSKGYAPFQAQGFFAATYCVRAIQANMEAKKAGDEKNPFFAGILLQLTDNCLFATQDALVLWFQAKGD